MNENKEARGLLNKQIDQQTAVMLARGLIASQQIIIGDQDRELDALRMDLRIETNKAADAVTGYNLWRDIAHKRNEEIKALGNLVDDLKAELYTHMRANHDN